MNPLQRALVEKTGHDHGFEHVLASDLEGVTLASALHAARASVSVLPEGGYLLRLQATTPALLPEMLRSFAQVLRADGFAASSEAALAALLGRSASLARALPSQAAQDFEAAVSSQLAQLPAGLGGTEVERLVRQRVGQQKFREAMLDYWGGTCAVTGVTLSPVQKTHSLCYGMQHKECGRWVRFWKKSDTAASWGQSHPLLRPNRCIHLRPLAALPPLAVLGPGATVFSWCRPSATAASTL